MQTSISEMPEADRRRHQQDIGLVIVSRRPEPQTQQTEKRKRMHEPQHQTRGVPGSKAQAALERMTENPTFKEVARHELQRAAVYVPILFSAGIGLAWTCKKLIFKTA